MFAAENCICWQTHVCILPEAWGRGARILREMFAWTWKTSAWERITASIPIFNSAAIHCALRAGMKPFGVNPRSYQKRGQLHHQLLMGIGRPRSLNPCPS